ncbi:MAG: PEP-CTERM sorting domain-containing protein [Planctomycetota bacterium]|jgi:uncharacterized membrane protein
MIKSKRLILVLLVCSITVACAGNDATFMLLGAGSSAQEISGDGSTVVGVTPSGEAGYWRADVGWQGLGFAGYAMDASYDGSVVVGFSGVSAQNIAANDAFRWTEAGGTVILPGPANQALAVSRDGQTVVGRHGTSLSSYQPFRYSASGGTVDMSGLTGMPTVAGGRAVSADGSVIAGEGPSDGFIWSAGDPGVIVESMAAQAISNDGTVITGFRGSPSGAEAVIWTAAGGVQTLPQLPGPPSGNHHFLQDMTGDGQTVTGYHDGDAEPRAFIWDAAVGMRYLQDELAAGHGLDFGDWRLKNAYVSDNGLVFAGRAVNDLLGENRGYFITVPEPAALSLLALGGSSLLRKRKK